MHRRMTKSLLFTSSCLCPAGESLVQVSASSSSSCIRLLLLLLTPPSYFPPTPFPTLYLIFLLFTSFSPSYFLFLFTTSSPSSSLFKLGKYCCSLALPSSTLSLSMRILSSAVVFSSQSEHTDGLLFPPLLCWELSITEDSQSCSHNSDSASL